MRILLIRTDVLGDAVVSAPFIETLANSLSSVQIDVLCTNGNYPAFQFNPYLTTKFVLNHEPGTKRLANNVDEVIAQVNQFDYDLVVVLNTCYRTFLYAVRIKTSKIIARSLFTKSFRANFFILRQKLFSRFIFFGKEAATHEVLRLDVFCNFILNRLGVSRSYPLPQLAKFYIAAELRANKLQNSIVINASGKITESRYLNDPLLFALIYFFAARYEHLSVIVTATDKARIKHLLEILSNSMKAIDIICDGDIFNIVNRIDSYQCFIGADGGMAHVAAGRGLKCVILFDRQSSEIWHPWTPWQISLRSSRGNIYDISHFEIINAVENLLID